MLTNAGGAINYSLAAVPAAAALAGEGGKEAWQVLVPEDERVAIMDMDVFSQGVVLQELRQGLPALRIVRFGDKEDGHEVPPCHISQVGGGGGGENTRCCSHGSCRGLSKGQGENRLGIW